MSSIVPTKAAWKAYAPSSSAPWNVQRVVHLHRRAGFGATWSEIQRDLNDGPDASIRRLLSGSSRTAGQPDNQQILFDSLTEQAVEHNDVLRLQGAWAYRLLFGKDPLHERLTLLWHNHFATSYRKVERISHMEAQNRKFRQHARGSFGALLREMLEDPALLLWLDAPANRKTHPNENLARELLELFTLGIGNYTEGDVKEAARALTGWTVRNARFEDIPIRHDEGKKTILGHTAHFRAPDLVELLLKQPATAHRLASRLCEMFMGEGVVTSAQQKSLADELFANQLDIHRAVATILHSAAFFDAPNINTRVTDPVVQVVSFVRALELFDPSPSTLILGQWMGRIGQELYNPPNVGGWNGGRAWLSGRTLIARTKFAHALVYGEEVGREESINPRAIARHYGIKEDLSSLAEFFAQLLFGHRLDDAASARLMRYCTRASNPSQALLLSLLTLPNAQLS